MTQFLGRKDCISSLRQDLLDLQRAILDVFSITGPVRAPSWKFPNKLSCNLDMVALLDQYDFVDGDREFNQLSHISLLELMIDRLLLLLQSSNFYVEQLGSTRKSQQSQHRGSPSVGHVVRDYWNHLVHLISAKVPRKPNEKSKTKPFDHTEMEAASYASLKMDSKSDNSRHCLFARSSTSSIKSLPQDRNSPCCPAVKSRNVSCQTIESSLIPCDACYQVQSILRKTGDAVVEFCLSEGLPSALQPLIAVIEETLEPGQMTAGDVAQWANEQLRDVRRLEKHLQDVRATVNPLKEKLAAEETEREKSRSQLEKVQKAFKQQGEKHQDILDELEFSLHETQRSMEETERRLQEEQQLLDKEIVSLRGSNSTLNEKLAEKQAIIQTLESEKSVLEEKEKYFQKRNQQLESQVSEVQVLLDKETAQHQSACRHQESIQAKHKSLLERMDALDKEYAELQFQLVETEATKTKLQDELQQMSEEKEQLQAQLTQQQELSSREKQTLNTSVDELKQSMAELKEYVQTLEERQRLLVAFPELSPLARTCPQITGNVVLDMEQQIQANSIRIKVLNQENDTLLRRLEKLRERAQHNADKEVSHKQIWNPSITPTPVEKQLNRLTYMRKNPSHSSRETRLRYSNRRKEASQSDSSLETTGSEEHVSATTGRRTVLQINQQNFQFDITQSGSRKRKTKRHNPTLLSHGRCMKTK